MNLTTQIHHYLTRAPTSHFLEQPVTMLEHWTGRDHLLWRVECRGQEAVLKLYLDAGQARSRRQFDGQGRFAPVGIAPQPLWYDRYPEGLSRQILVYIWVPGAPFDTTDDGQLLALARSVATIHRGDPGEVRRFSPNPVNLDYWWRVQRGGFAPIRGWLARRGAVALAALFDELAAQTERLVTDALPLWQGSAPTPVHGDLQVEHVIDSFGTAVLLDWERYGLGDPALEVATFLGRSQGTWAAERQRRWLAEYLALVDEPTLALRIELYQLLLPFQDVAFLLNGLRTHLDSALDQAEVAAAQPFLADTLQQTLLHSAQGLGLTVEAETTAAMITDLFAGPPGSR
jgi:hypothetical protein